MPSRILKPITVAILLGVVAVGLALISGGQGLADQSVFTPGGALSIDHPVVLGPLGDYTIWAMNMSSSLAEDWNMNVTYYITGNSTTIIQDANGGTVFKAFGQYCSGVPPLRCGGGLEFGFTVPAGVGHELQVLVHNNSTAVATMNDTSVSYSYVTYPSAAVGTELEYVGGVFVAAGSAVLILGILVAAWGWAGAGRAGPKRGTTG